MNIVFLLYDFIAYIKMFQANN